VQELAIRNDKRMTVREVADVLGVTDDKIYRSAKELFPEIFINGKTTYLNEAQVTAVKMNLRKTAEVMAQPKTSLEKALLIKQAMQFQQEIIESLQTENTELKAKAESDKPKVEFYDQVAGSGDAISIREVAAILNIPGWGQNRIFALLRNMKILDIRNVPYREYQDRGYFRVIEQKWTDKEGDTHINLKTLVYQKGVNFIRKIVQKQEAA